MSGGARGSADLGLGVLWGSRLAPHVRSRGAAAIAAAFTPWWGGGRLGRSPRPIAEGRLCAREEQGIQVTARALGRREASVPAALLLPRPCSRRAENCNGPCKARRGLGVPVSVSLKAPRPV